MFKIDQVHKVLRNKAYIGVRVFSSKGGNEDEVKAVWPAIITKTQSDRLRAILTDKKRDRRQGKPNAKYLLTGGLAVWGAPTSLPTLDPALPGVMYQRFKRGVLRYDPTQGTAWITIANYLKAVMLGEALAGTALPSDLAAQSAGNRFSTQYCPGEELWLCRRGELTDTDLTLAFEPQSETVSIAPDEVLTFVELPTNAPAAVIPVQAADVSIPTTPPVPASVPTPSPTSSPTPRPTRTPTSRIGSAQRLSASSEFSQP